MKICGVHFANNRPVLLQSLMTLRAALLASIVINFIIFPAILAMIEVWGDLTLVIDNIIIFIPYSMSICHLFTMWYNRKEISELFSEMKKDWTAQKNILQHEIMVQNAKISMNIIRFAYIIAALLVAMHNIPFWIGGIIPRTLTNLTDGERPLLMQTYYFYDVSVYMNFRLTAIGQSMSSSTAAMCYTTAGCIFYTFVLHVCGQLKILKHFIENIFNNNDNKNEISEKTLARLIKISVKRHQKLIKFSGIVENIFNMMFLQQFLGMMITISAEGFLIISMLVGDVEVPVVGLGFVVIYVIYCMIMTLMYCTGGEYLIASSNALHSAAYNSLWYNSGQTFRMEITMIINRAQRPLYITAGKFSPISLTTFTKFMKTTASYMSVLLAVKS
uniref:Odorant receptor n=1 Tax=Meteorus pulchricornis TaxID=51522 RepID=A0A1S5VFL1_9HYME|nr:olfactory receptor 18 [Meteorus pulchricornis]